LTSRIFRVALTGGIASGKSTVADMFGDLGAVLIDTDIIAREVVLPGTPGLQDIVDTFGTEMLDADGMLDRPAMRRLVFADDAKRRQLEAILHPKIRQEAERQMQTRGGPYQIVIVPLLVESPLKNLVDRIVVVDCSEAIQLERLLARDIGTKDQARRMLAAQASRQERLALADDVIANDADIAETRIQVAALHARYLALAAASSA
jgi:dephospho-CoA kinase